MTALVARATFRPGSSDSAAAIVTASAPTHAEDTGAAPRPLPARRARLGGGYRHDLRPDEREDHGRHPAEHRQRPVGEEAALGVEVSEPRGASAGPEPDHEQGTEPYKDQDGYHLYSREPELELPV